MITEHYFTYNKKKLLKYMLLFLAFATPLLIIVGYLGYLDVRTNMPYCIFIGLLAGICLFSAGHNLFRLFSKQQVALYFDKQSLLLYPGTKQEILIPWEDITGIYLYTTNSDTAAKPTHLLFEVADPQKIIAQGKSALQQKLMRLSLATSNCPVSMIDNLDISLYALRTILLEELKQHKEISPDMMLRPPHILNKTSKED